MSKIVIDVDDDFHKNLRISAIEEGKTMKDYIIEAVSSFMKRDKTKTTNFNFKAELDNSIEKHYSILQELKIINK